MDDETIDQILEEIEDSASADDDARALAELGTLGADVHCPDMIDRLGVQA